MVIMVQGESSPFVLSQVHTTTTTTTSSSSSSSSSSTCAIKKRWRAVAVASVGGGASTLAPTLKLQHQRRRRRSRPSATEQHHFGSWTGAKTKKSVMPLALLRRAIVQTSDVVGAAADVTAAPETDTETETETETEEEEKKRAATGGDGYSAVIQPSPSPGSPVGLASLILDGLEKALVWAFHDSSLPPHFISGDYGPTTETPPCSSLPVIGHLPSCLNGEFVRVGPNPKFKPVAGYHWFDGDGMIHGLRIKDGKATYVSRYVRTSKLLQEEFFGAAKFMKLGDSIGIFGLFMSQITKYRAKFKVLDTSEGTGTGNTALTYHGGRLLALHEADKPYAIKISEDGDLQTLGYLDFGKQLNHPFTAHPKVDPVTGEMFMFGYQFEEPYCVYRVISKEGEMQDAVPITLSGPSMMHDFAITENYAIFMDLPLSYNPEVMLKGNMFLSFDPSKKSRFGILPRYAKDDSQMQWFELPNCYIFHNANAWEEGDEVVLYSCLLSNANLEIFAVPLRESVKCYDTALYELRFNQKTGHASWKQLSVSTVDLPRINDKYIGRKQRYVYGIIMENNKNKGIAKFDLNSAPDLEGKREIETGGNVKVFSFGPGRYGSEAVFVPKTSGADESEDDGYLITFCYDENTRKSEALVIDAKTMAPEPAAAVQIPSGIPFGFHAAFISEEELQKQKV